LSRYGSEYFLSRELSWLEFEQRLLAMAAAPANPLLERLKYLAITSTNLDEFFTVRVGSLHNRLRGGNKPDLAGMTASQQLDVLSERVRGLYRGMGETYSMLCCELEDIGIRILTDAALLTEKQRTYADTYTEGMLLPLLSPVDDAALIPSNVPALAVLFEDGGFAALPLPRLLPRLVSLSESPQVFITCEALAKAALERLYPKRRVRLCGMYRVTRNGDIDADADRSDKLPKVVRSVLERRGCAEAIRLETEADMPDKLLDKLKKRLGTGRRDIYRASFPLDLSFLRSCVCDSVRDGDGLRFPAFTPSVPQEVARIAEGENLLDVIARGDILLHHPYQSFEPVVRLLQDSAADPAVEAIKLTLYRLSDDSPVIDALAAAALSGKRVTVLLEARARFDEKNNLEYGSRLELAGCKVIYGIPRLKTHSKIILIYRREGKLLRKYVHLGTGNYNDATARQYTDCSLLTARPGIAADGAEFFRALSDSAYEPDMEYLTMAPYGLRDRFIDELRHQQSLAEAGLPAGVFAKMNSLVDGRLCEELLRTAEAGVDVRLLVRGACCLRPQNNLRIRSVIGRFLEHSRFYCFGVGADRRVFLSSADWMPRNMDRRVELLFPVLDRSSADNLCGDMELYWRDNVCAAELCADGSYCPVAPVEGQPLTDAQKELLLKYTS